MLPYAAPWYSPEFDEGEDRQNDRGQAMVKALLEIDSKPEESYRRDSNLRLARMYEQAPLVALYQFAGKYYGNVQASDLAFVLDDPATWNVMRSVAQTAASQIGRSNPHPKFITIDGTIPQKRRAKAAENFCNGWAEEVDLYALTFRTLIDCLVFDLAGVMLYEEDGRICVERAFGSEFSVDPFEAARGTPNTLYRTVPVPKDRLISKFAKDKDGKVDLKKRQAIEQAPELGMGSGMALVHSAWHLKSGANETDGRYVLAVEGVDGTLVDEQYDSPTFPAVFIRWDSSLGGWYGVSLCADLRPLQENLNRRLRRLDTSDRLVGVPRLALPRGSKILQSQLTNLPGSQIEYSGQIPPSILQWAAATADAYQFIENIVQKMYDIPGISRQAAAGQKDAGVKSGAAIRESIDVQAVRMQPKAKLWENYHLRIFKKLIELLATMEKRANDEAAAAKEDGTKGNKRKKAVERKKAFSYRVKAPGRKKIALIDWRSVKYDADELDLSIQPVSSLPLTAQGRLDYALDMLSAGLWNAARVAEVMEDLDIDSASKTLAVQRLIEDDFEKMIEDGEPRYPDFWTPFDQAIDIGTLYLAEARLNKSNPKNIDMAARYLKECKRLDAQAKAQAAPPAPATPAQPAQAAA
jgi:hypothetical protein